MDTELSRSPLATVQLVPIFSYLNLLGDFLFAKNYLTEDNHNQQISIVNALYEYLEDYRDHLPETEVLIRNLLQGSDLYGAQENENLDPLFVNSMFDYIISSLVFDKYGNIYGFLADIIRKYNNFQFDHIMKIIKLTLQSATFENEYGDTSTLSPLAVNRIYNDIILPLFPQPKTNLGILSLDYFLAQGGSMYLRLGRLNDSYYPDLQQHSFTKIDENLFDEYLATGHIIANLVDSKKIDLLTLRVFALPALCFYVSTEKKVQSQAITNIIFDPGHWKLAYKNVLNAFKKIKDQLVNDKAYNLHLALMHFQSRLAIAKSNLNSHCDFLSEADEEKLIPNYLEATEYFQCPSGAVLPNVNEQFTNQIHDVVDAYGRYQLEMLEQYFNTHSLGELYNVEIKLHKCNPILNTECKNSQQIHYDLLEFFFIDRNMSNFYALIQGNYNVTLIKEADDPQLFRQKLGLSQTFDELKRSTNHVVILKLGYENIYAFFEELVEYKQGELNSYLQNTDNHRETNKWWKEFGLSLVPSYPCLFNREKKEVCKMNGIQFLNQFQKDVSSLIMDMTTLNLLSSFGTSIKTVFVKELIDETIVALQLSHNESWSFLQNEIAMNNFFNTLSLRIEEPECESVSITANSIQLVKTVFDTLKEQMIFHYTLIDHMLNIMGIFKTNLIKDINYSVMRNQTLFVKTFYGDTGFGYKFIFTRESGSKTDIALFRTGYDYKDEMFVSLQTFAPKNKKIYFKLEPDSLEYDCDSPVFEVNNQLRRRNIKILFSGISTYHDNNEECATNEDLLVTLNSNACLRHWKFHTKTYFEKMAEQLLKNQSILVGLHLSEEQIHNTLKKYTFPDDETFIQYFVKKLVSDSNFEKSEWSESCLIDNAELLNKLRFYRRLEDDDVSIADGERRINSIYTYRERNKIEEGTSIKSIISDYNEQEASYSAAFEDYYAIRNFATTGNTRITGDTNEAKLMKLALYKLAIRQSDDPEHEFDLKLFRVECKPKNLVHNLLTKGKHITLKKFTSTSTNVESAFRLSVLPAAGFTNVLYVMDFFGPYFRAKIETGMELPTKNKKIILLPGSIFTVKKISLVKIMGMDNVLKVELSFDPHGIEKHKWYKNIMNEITKIKV